jgi:hypothetical protein
MARAVLLLLLLPALAAWPAPAAAQIAARADRTLGGFWLHAEYGLGNAWIDCVRCPPGDDSPWSGGAGWVTGLGAGGTPHPNIEVGGEFGYFRTLSRDGQVAQISIVGATARFFPSDTSPFSVRAGIGLGTLDLAGTIPHDARSTERGVALRGAVAYDIRIAHAYALVPALGISWVLTGEDERQIARNPGYLHLMIGLLRY